MAALEFINRDLPNLQCCGFCAIWTMPVQSVKSAAGMGLAKNKKLAPQSGGDGPRLLPTPLPPPLHPLPLAERAACHVTLPLSTNRQQQEGPHDRQPLQSISSRGWGHQSPLPILGGGTTGLCSPLAKWLPRPVFCTQDRGAAPVN